MGFLRLITARGDVQTLDLSSIVDKLLASLDIFFLLVYGTSRSLYPPCFYASSIRDFPRIQGTVVLMSYAEIRNNYFKKSEGLSPDSINRARLPFKFVPTARRE